MDYRDQLARLFKIKIAEGAPFQRIREEFADGLHGLLVGADLWRLGMLMRHCWVPDSHSPSNYPPGLMSRPDGTEMLDEHPLDPVYKLLLSRDERILALRDGVRESQLLGAFAAWLYVELCDMLSGDPASHDLAAVDRLLQYIHLAIVRGSERTMEQHIEDVLGEAELKRVEAQRAQSRSLARQRWSRTNRDRELAVQAGLAAQDKERFRAGAARRVLRELQELTGGVYELKTVDRWLKEAGWKSTAPRR